MRRKVLSPLLEATSVSVRALLLFAIAAITSFAALEGMAGNAGAEQYAFEAQGRPVTKGSDPQIGTRASGELFLLHLKDKGVWLKTSGDGGDSFEEAVRVNDGGEVASHSENTPMMIVRTMREFYVLWTAEDDKGRNSLRLASSVDWGKSFGKSVTVDPTGPVSQSFFTLAVGPDGVIYAAWLDSRDRGQGKSGSSGLYIARSTNRGQSFEKSIRVALSVCPCCRPSIAFTDAKTLHIGWRGVMDGDVRDIFVATSTDGGLTFPTSARIAEDNWQLNGCPHSGPSLATLGGKLFIAWHTAVGDRSRLFITSSSDNGAHFSSKIEASTNLVDANHPKLVRLENTIGLVFQARQAAAKDSWNKLDVYFRQIDGNGALTPLQRIKHVTGSAIYPTLLYERPDHLFVAWTEGTEDGKKVMMARGRLASSDQAIPAKAKAGSNLTTPITKRRTND